MKVKEIWETIKWAPRYKISNKGRIRGVYGKLIKPQVGTWGYLSVIIYLEKNKRKFVNRPVHRLVAETFLGKSDLCVNHKDGNKLNNNIENLEFVSYSENNKHAFKLGLKKITNYCNNIKLNDNQIISIRKGYPNKSLRDLAKEFNVSHNCIYRIITKRSYKYVG